MLDLFLSQGTALVIEFDDVECYGVVGGNYLEWNSIFAAEMISILSIGPL
jgi:hypothetical protein